MADPIRVVGPAGPAGELEAEAGPWIQRLARAGFAAKGVVYALIAAIALRAALGRGQATSSRGALQALLGAPLGRALLAIMAVGLAGYAAWRAYTALADPEHDGTRGRIRHGFIAAVHIGLAAESARLALGAHARGGDRPSHWAAEVLGLLGVVAAGLFGYAVYEFVRARFRVIRTREATAR